MKWSWAADGGFIKDILSRQMAATFSPRFFVLASVAVALTLVLLGRRLAHQGPKWRLAHTLRLVMIGAFSVGTCTHLENCWRAGYLPLPQQPVGFNLYWTLLTLFDPLAIALLVARPRAGLVLGLLIMISDISINACAFPPSGALHVEWPFWLQVAFTLFLCAASPYCWRSLRGSAPGEAARFGS